MDREITDYSSAGQQTIFGLVERRAMIAPDSIALVADRRDPLNYADLFGQMQSTAAFLHSAGIGWGDTVAVVLSNGPEMAAAFLAIGAAATCAPLNPDYRQAEFEFYLSDLAAKAVVVPWRSDSPSRHVATKMEIPVIELEPIVNQPVGLFKLSAAAGLKSTTGRAPESCEESDIALVLHTSGTTSRPKMVPLSHANICTSAAGIARHLALSPQDRCLNVMPLFHIHGLIGALLSSVTAGGSIVCADGFHTESFLRQLGDHRPTWYTAVPTIHQAIVACAAKDPQSVSRHCLRFIRSSSSALAPTVMAELERTFAVPVVESYGMTEAAHQMAGNPLPPAVRKPGSVGLPAGPEMAIQNDSGQLLGAGETGEIVIRGPSVMCGYAHNPEANGTAFVNGWFRTGDRGRIDADGYFYITGRTKEMINRGGENISPREIDEALLQHDAISQAVAFAVPHERLGEDVAAAVVLRDGANASEQELREFLMSHLAQFKVPSQIVFVTEIPKGPTGKLQRIGLYEKLRSRLQPEFVAPRSLTEQVLTELWQEVLAVRPVGVNHNFFGVGGDSLLAAQLTVRINARFALDLSVATVFRFPTVSSQAILVESELIEQIERMSN